MRKVFSIFLIAPLFLNILGYYGVFLGLQYKNDLSMTRKLDAEDYKESETITIKIPIILPYSTDSKNFERVNGKFEHNKEFFRLVKQRLWHDTLFIVCIKDPEKKRIHQAISHFVRSFSDKPAGHQSNTKDIVSFIKDYITADFKLGSAAEGWRFSFNFHTSEEPILPLSLPILSPPPEV